MHLVGRGGGRALAPLGGDQKAQHCLAEEPLPAGRGPPQEGSGMRGIGSGSCLETGTRKGGAGSWGQPRLLGSRVLGISLFVQRRSQRTSLSHSQQEASTNQVFISSNIQTHTNTISPKS